MKHTLNIRHILNKMRSGGFPPQGTSTPFLTTNTTQMEDDLLKNKNAIISGDFFPTSESLFKEKLLKENVNVQQHMTPETDLLICGKYPDWILVEEARFYGVKIIFIDKAGELFSRLATTLHKSSTFSFEEPLGI